MAKSKKRLNKHVRSLIALLMVLGLLFAIDCFMEGSLGIFSLFEGSPAASLTESPAEQPSAGRPSAAEGMLDVYVLDVGQGDSIFLRSPSGKTMLVDASTSDMYERIDGFLKEQGVTILDVVIGTHPHADHIGGMQQVLSNYEVGTYYMPDAVNETKMFENLIDALDAQNISVKKAVGGENAFIEWDDQVEIRILSPLADVTYDDLNDASVVCRVRFGDTSILLTGDAERYAEKAALKELPASYFRSTVLKVGHHGSNSSTSAAFLDAVGPEAAVASLGANNEYGHPHEEVVQALKSADIPFYRTDVSGTIHITMDGAKYSIETEK